MREINFTKIRMFWAFYQAFYPLFRKTKIKNIRASSCLREPVHT